VARTAGSLIVNSSQGGGSKDTWVVDATLADLDDTGALAGHDDQFTSLTNPPDAHGDWTDRAPRLDGREMAQ
jgi:hypothetical protein